MHFILRALIRRGIVVAIATAAAQTFAGPTGYSVRSDVDRRLYRIDMATGEASDLGATGFSKVEGLAINASGELYGVNPPTAQLVKCSAAGGACTAVGTLSGLPQLQTNAGLAFASTGALYLAMNAVIYRVDPATAATAALGGTGPALAGLAGVAPSSTCPSGLYGMGGNNDRGKFYCININNGVATLLGTVNGVSPLDVGLDGDLETGFVWGISNDVPGQVFAVDPATLKASNVNTVTIDGKAIGGFESLAVARYGTMAVGDRPIAVAANTAIVVPTLDSRSLIALMLGLALMASRQLRRSLPHAASARK